MSNVIQIKRGYAKPAPKTLKDFELGIIRNELGGQPGMAENDYNFYSGCLYIGENSNIYPVKVESALSLDVVMSSPVSFRPESSELINGYPDYNGSNIEAKVSFIDIDNYSSGGTRYNSAVPYSNNVPTGDAAWWHIMRVGAYTDGNYYTDIAIPFTQPSIYYKQVLRNRNGTVIQAPYGVNGGDIKWVKVLDEDNYSSTITNVNSLTVGKLILTSDMYGNNFPSSPATGQLYFKLVEES